MNGPGRVAMWVFLHIISSPFQFAERKGGYAKMDLTAISTFISSIGFPIACTVAMGWFAYHQGEVHREEMSKITEALNNNTIAITKLSSKMDEVN